MTQVYLKDDTKVVRRFSREGNTFVVDDTVEGRISEDPHFLHWEDNEGRIENMLSTQPGVTGLKHVLRRNETIEISFYKLFPSENKQP